MMIEVLEYNELGFKRLVEFDAWTVAMLNDTPMYTLEKVGYFQKHNETDEVFILLSGECTLFTAGQGEAPSEILAHKMEQGKFYNIKAGVWHTHILAPDTKVVVVENRSTGLPNSPISDITDKQRARLAELLS